MFAKKLELNMLKFDQDFKLKKHRKSASFQDFFDFFTWSVITPLFNFSFKIASKAFPGSFKSASRKF